MINDAEKAAEAATYPKPTSDGFFFEDAANETLGIESKEYENGKIVRRVKLSNGQTAIVRELTGREINQGVQRLATTKEDYQVAMMAIATTIDQKQIVMEDLLEMRGRDFTRLQVANAQVNFS